MANFKTGLPATVSDDPRELARTMNKVLEFIRRLNGEHDPDDRAVLARETKTK
jgi:hypothetical protein